MTVPGGTGVWVAFAISLSRQDTQRLKHVTKQMDGKWHWFMQRVSIMWAQWMENCEVWHLFEWCKPWEIFQIIYLVGKKANIFVHLFTHSLKSHRVHSVCSSYVFLPFLLLQWNRCPVTNQGQSSTWQLQSKPSCLLHWLHSCNSHSPFPISVSVSLFHQWTNVF